MSNVKAPIRTPWEDISYNAKDARYYHDGRLFSGVAVSESPRATDEQEFRYGLRWGYGWTRDAEGRLVEEGTFRMDLLYGVKKEWDEQERLRSEARYEHGILIEGREWDDSGALVKEHRIPEGSPRLAEMRRLYGTPEEVAAEEKAYRNQSSEE
jgi:hypothetical protein